MVKTGQDGQTVSQEENQITIRMRTTETTLKGGPQKGIIATDPIQPVKTDSTIIPETLLQNRHDK